MPGLDAHAASSLTPRHPNDEASTIERGVLGNGFDRVRIISLARRKDRREETLEELDTLGDRIDGPRIGWFDALAPATADGFPNAAVRGCFLSHLSVLENALAAGVERLLVLEDDVAFIDDAPALLPGLLARLDTTDWRMAYLGHGLPRAAGTPRWQAVSGPTPQAHCYAIHGSALADLVAFLRAILNRPPGHPEGGPMHVDGALSLFALAQPRGRALFATRSLAYQRPSRTDLHRCSVIDRSAWLKPLARPIRQFKRQCLKRLR